MCKRSCRVCYPVQREPCLHPWRHTVYGSWVLGRNGTFCVICGASL